MEELREDGATQPQTEQSAKIVETVTTDASTTPSPAPTDPEPAADEPSATHYASQADVLAALEALAQKDPAEIATDELARLKHVFYKLEKAEEPSENSEPSESSETSESPEAARLRELLTTIKEKKAEARRALEAQQEENLKAKKTIVATILEMSADTDNVNRHYQRVKDLQTEFKAAGEVPPTAQADIWKEYQDAVEKFYDQLKINKELRDYDFRKNLADKQLLIDEAEKLNDEDDVVTAFRRLQALHDKWREIGPVAKELREDLWMRFKDASTAVNKRYQTHFEERKARERENEEAKTALCERVEAIEFADVRSYAKWDEMTKQIMEAQEEWKKLGFASKKANNALFARFREVCDRFFTAKADFFKGMKEELAQNLARKTALCERAEALKESKEWKKTTDELVALQKEWKTIGAVPKKHSDAVWRRFLDACDYFFEEKKRSTSGQRKAEQANLKAKQELIDKLAAIPEGTPREEVLQAIRDARTQWQEIGHVPFREKDKIYESFRNTINELYDKHDIRETRARFNEFRENIRNLEGDDTKLGRERERLVRTYEQRRSELATYENNLGFLSSKSKSGDGLVREMERRVERLKEEIATLEKKIEVIDSNDNA